MGLTRFDPLAQPRRSPAPSSVTGWAMPGFPDLHHPKPAVWVADAAERSGTLWGLSWALTATQGHPRESIRDRQIPDNNSAAYYRIPLAESDSQHSATDPLNLSYEALVPSGLFARPS